MRRVVQLAFLSLLLYCALISAQQETPSNSNAVASLGADMYHSLLDDQNNHRDSSYLYTLTKRGILNKIGAVAKGAVNSFVTTTKVAFNSAKDYKGTWRKFKYAAKNPRQSIKGMINKLRAPCPKYRKAECVGEGIGYVAQVGATFFAPQVAAAYLGTAAGAAVLAGTAVTGVTSKAEFAGDGYLSEFRREQQRSKQKQQQQQQGAARSQKSKSGLRFNGEFKQYKPQQTGIASRDEKSRQQQQSHAKQRATASSLSGRSGTPYNSGNSQRPNHLRQVPHRQSVRSQYWNRPAMGYAY
ncbi:hypothetical protein MIR68_008850 [Amoeboaphelidium protococcarum]|nr:hypothetical protein MIR68_008850 [Amoeboaphelidium protococcarum]